MVKWHLPIPKFFDFEECLWFLHRNFDECLYQVGPDYVERGIRLPDRNIDLSILSRKSNLEIQTSVGDLTNDEVNLVSQFVIDWFDLDRDLAPFLQKLRKSPALRYMASDFVGLRMMGIPDMFEAIVWCIIGQQINLTFAYQLKRRLVERYGQALSVGDKTYWLFPKPIDLLDCDPDELRAMQYSRQKIEYIMEVARAFDVGRLDKSTCLNLPTQSERLTYLQAIKGIGPWTANYVLMKCLRDTQAVPYGDAGLLAALEKHLLISNRKDRESMESLFAQFEGFESYLVLYLWRSLAPRPDLSH